MASVGRVSTGPSEHQFSLLFRTFVHRLFESSQVSETVDLRQSLIWTTAIFAAPPMIVAIGWLPKYSLVAQVFPERLNALTWPDKFFLIGYSMATIGFLTVHVWDALFPDRLDAQVLGPLPVRQTTVLTAKIAALVSVVLGFAVAVNVPGALTFSIAAGSHGTLVHMLRFGVSHLVATVGAALFVFLSLMALRVTCTLVLPRRLLRTVTVVLQISFVVGLLEWLFFSHGLPALLVVLDGTVAGEPAVPPSDFYLFFGHIVTGGIGAWLPPVWFLGLDQVTAGVDDGLFQSAAMTALWALAIALLVTTAGYAATYRRVLRWTTESPARLGGCGVIWRLARHLAFATVLRHRAEQAVFAFTARSLARSRRHRLLLAAYVGVGLGLVIAGFLTQVFHWREPSLDVPTVALLSMPILLSTFTLVGLRAAFSIPTELKANWVFRLTELDDTTAYVNGARKTMLLLGLPPIAVTTVPLYWAVWGPAAALGHTVFWMLLAFALADLLVLGFHKVPFTCSYVPGQANLKLLGPLFLLALIIYAQAAATLQAWLVADPPRWVAGCLVAGLLLALSTVARKRTPVPPPTLTYEESIDSAVQVLHLMPPV